MPPVSERVRLSRSQPRSPGRRRAGDAAAWSARARQPRASSSSAAPRGVSATPAGRAPAAARPSEASSRRSCWLTLGCAMLQPLGRAPEVELLGERDERPQLPQLHRRMIGNAYHSDRNSLLIARAPPAYGRPWWREPARQRLRLPPRGVPDARRGSGLQAVRPRGSVRASTRAPAPRRRSSSATSSATGSCRATTTSGRSSRTRRRSRRRTPRRRTSRAPPEVAGDPRRRRTSRYVSGLSGAPASRPHAPARLHQEGVHAAARSPCWSREVRALTVAMIERIAARGRGDLVADARLRAARARHLPPARRARRGRAAGQGVGAEPRLPELRRPADRASRSSTPRNLVELLALLPGARRVAASRSRATTCPATSPASTWRATQSLEPRRDRRPRLHAAVRRARDDDLAARRAASRSC